MRATRVRSWLGVVSGYVRAWAVEERVHQSTSAVESDDGSGCGRVPFGVGKGLVESTSRGPPVF